jgi:hypothetical protein
LDPGEKVKESASAVQETPKTSANSSKPSIRLISFPAKVCKPTALPDLPNAMAAASKGCAVSGISAKSHANGAVPSTFPRMFEDVSGTG